MTVKEAFKNIDKILYQVAIGNIKLGSRYLNDFRKTVKRALEKQMPKKPIPYYDDEGKCPVCKNLLNLSGGYKTPFCYECGQAIDWSDTE